MCVCVGVRSERKECMSIVADERENERKLKMSQLSQPLWQLVVNIGTHGQQIGGKKGVLTVDDDFHQLEGHFVSTPGRTFVFSGISSLIQNIDQQRSIREGSLSVIIGYPTIICR